MELNGSVTITIINLIRLLWPLLIVNIEDNLKFLKEYIYFEKIINIKFNRPIHVGRQI